MAKKSTANTSKKVTKKTQKKEPVLLSTPVQETSSIVAPTPAVSNLSKMSPRILSFALVVVGIALLTYKIGPYFVPAFVGSVPVTRFEVWSRLEKSYGAQTLDDLVNEKILDRAIRQSGVKVDQAKVDEQIKGLETQFETSGGLDAALEQRGMSRPELVKQVKTQLAVEEILKDKVNPTDDEIKKVFDEGVKTTYKDKKFDDVKAQIKDELTQTKLVEAFREWFETVKTAAKLKQFGL